MSYNIICRSIAEIRHSQGTTTQPASRKPAICSTAC
jgi:hypothetical protein